MAEPIETRSTSEQMVLAVRDVLPGYDGVEQLFDQVERYLAEVGIHASGPRIALFWGSAEQGRDVEAAAAIPIQEEPDGRAPADEPLMVEILPAVEHMASMIHHGRYETLGESVNAIRSWAERQGYNTDAPWRVVESSEWLEVQVPLRQRR
jgi:effector-binding domain-containing protein